MRAQTIRILLLVSIGLLLLEGAASLSAQAEQCAKAGPQSGVWQPGDCTVYIITGSVSVAAGTTLEIKPGALLRFDKPETEMVVDGTLLARGTAVAPISFSSNASEPQGGDWGRIRFSPSAVGAVFDENGAYQSGSIIEHAIIEYAGARSAPLGLPAVTVDGAAPLLLNNTIRFNRTTGVQFNRPSSSQPAARLVGNIIEANGTPNSGLASYGVNSARSLTAVGNTIVGTIGSGIWAAPTGSGSITVVLSGNRIVENQGIGAYVSSIDVGASRSTATVTGNQFIRNTGDLWGGGCQGGGLRANMDATITENLFLANGRRSGSAICLESNALTLTIRDNDFLGPACLTPPLVHNARVQDLDAQGNYWGTTDTARIRQLVFDFEDQPSQPFRAGVVRFDPVRTTSATGYQYTDSCAYLPLLRR